MITPCVPVGDGRLGYTEDAPYNAIHVGAAAPTLPQAVSQRNQLRPDLPNSLMGKEVKNN